MYATQRALVLLGGLPETSRKKTNGLCLAAYCVLRLEEIAQAPVDEVDALLIGRPADARPFQLVDEVCRRARAVARRRIGVEQRNKWSEKLLVPASSQT